MIPKFRCWDLDQKIMYYEEDLSINFYKDEIYVETETLPDFDKYELWDFELMQSTGMKDKNGNEIYVGDIIKHDPMPNSFYDHYFEIIQAKTGEWRIDNIRGGSVLAFHHDKIEVVGNIYENEELLEGIG